MIETATRVAASRRLAARLRLLAAMICIACLPAWLSPAACCAGGIEAVPEIPLVRVEGGCFRMGDIFNAGGPDEKPVHEACVDTFFMAKYPVTRGQWGAVMGSTPSRSQGRDDLPVDRVSWNDAQAFVKALRDKTGRNWRLPSEAEWEYAARGRGREQMYPGALREAELGEYAWYEANSDLQLHPVATRKPNELGLYDMAGNVWQWVQDRYERDYYRHSPRHNPKGDPFGVNRILKGGAVYQQAGFLRVSYRDYQDPDRRSGGVGFRLALSGE